MSMILANAKIIFIKIVLILRGIRLKGGEIMKLVNPLGRMASDMFVDRDVVPMACMCSGEKAYARTRGRDGCFKCGCSCSSTRYSAGNSKKAIRTVRGSGYIE